MASPSPPTSGFHANGASLNDIIMMELSDRLHPNDYRPLGIRLGFSETRLAHIEKSRLGVISECAYMMLTEWKRREGQDANVQLLIQAIRESKNSEAADWLQTELGLSRPAMRTISVEEKLNEGNVPALPDCLIERPIELAELRGKLRRAASMDKPGRWVVVYGMGGMGKTVLANQAVRDEKLVDEYFSDGIFWMSMGNVKEDTNIPDRLETLCRIFDTNLSSAPSPPKTLEQWKNLLAKLISQRYPRSLLVLDDIWIPKVVAAFDVHSTILITTRDSGVMSRVSGGDKDELNLSEGLSKDQSIQALADWTDIPVADLPPEAERIHAFSCGSPLVIAIVGALLRDFPDRWQFYVTQMEAKKLKELSSDSSYEYRSVYDAIDISVEQLTESQMEVYSWFAIFDEGTKISSQILAMLVECSKEEVEDRMRGITQRSLVCTDWSAPDECRVYWLHDLLHDHLVAKGAAKDKPPSVCNEFRCLLTLCKFKSCRRDIIQTALYFPPSSSVHRRALRVVQQTRGGFYTIETSNAQPLTQCLRHGINGKTARRAKLLPGGNEVASIGYEGLLQIADKNSGAVRFSTSAHTESISDLSISPDGALLATSCTADRCINIWNVAKDCSQSQRHVKKLCQDNTRIVCCTFVLVRKELMLVSADDSGCLKVWDGSFMLKNSVQAHDSTVIACSPCHNEGTILTCAKGDDRAMVFSVSSGERKCEIQHSDDVLDAAFVSNGMIVTTTGFEVQVSNSSNGRRICTWSGNTEHEFFEKLTCCSGSDGHLIAVTGRGGTITVLRMGATFQITRNLSVFCRLKTGGLCRDLNHTSISAVKGGKGSKESIFLTTTHECGLIMVWRIVKQDPPLTLGHSLWDASFHPNGELNCLVGTENADSKQVVMLTKSNERNFGSSTRVLKAGDGININAIDINHVPGQAGVFTDEGIHVVKLPKPGKHRGKSGNDCQVFNPSETKLLLARVIGNKRELLTVSTGSGISIEIWSTDKQPSVVFSRPVITTHQGLTADLSPDQTSLIVGCSDGTALLFKLSDGRPLDEDPTHLKGPASRVSQSLFSADGKLLLLAGWKHLKVFDARTLQELSSITEDTPILRARFILGSTMVITASGTMLKVRTPADGVKKSSLKSFTAIKDIAISSDGAFIATIGHVRTFDNGYIEWYKVEEAGNLVLLQRFRLNSRAERIICNPQFTSFVTVDELGHIFLLERINTDK